MKTELEEIQAMIDKCNGRNGCDSCCDESDIKTCWKLKAHSDRIAYCTEANIPIERW